VKPGRGERQQQDAGTVLALEASLQQVHGEAIAVGHEAGAYTVREGDRLESRLLHRSLHCGAVQGATTVSVCR
jgi:hypothetical protein